MTTSLSHKAVLALTMGAVMALTTACNTVKGVGRDIESVGQKGEEVIKGE